MRFAVLVITDEKPTQDILAKTLTPFGQAGHEHWDWWTFGGRFSGNLIPVEFENVVSAGPTLRPVEIGWLEIAMFNQKRKRVSPGVDALQHKNLAGAYPEFFPRAVVLQGQWHECEVVPVKALGLRLGLEENVAGEDLETERVAAPRWAAKFEELMAKVPADYWISVIDCHR